MVQQKLDSVGYGEKVIGSTSKVTTEQKVSGELRMEKHNNK